MIAAVVLVALTYILPFVAVYLTGIPSTIFGEDGSWATVAGTIGGKFMGIEWLRFPIVLGGGMRALGMFNGLEMSNLRLPMVEAWGWVLPGAVAKTGQRTND